jgi:hypothetical protein
MACFDNFKIVKYDIKSNGQVSFIPFNIDKVSEHENENNKSQYPITTTSSVASSSATNTNRSVSPDTVNDYNNHSGSISTASASNTTATVAPDNVNDSDTQNDDLKHHPIKKTKVIDILKDNTIKFSEWLITVYKSHFIVNKLKLLVNLLKLKNIEFKIQLRSNKLYILFKNHKLNMAIFAKIMTGGEKMFSFYIANNKSFSEFVKLLSKKDLKRLNFISKK